MFRAFSEVSTLCDASSVAAQQVSEAEQTFSLIAMWLKSTAWISLIKTIEEEVSFCHREYKCDTQLFSFFPALGKFHRKMLQHRKQTLCADFVTAVTRLWQLLLSFVYFDSATLKAFAPLSRWANLHKREVESIMLV